jgi:chemotaxis protein methyltransferase CheR
MAILLQEENLLDRATIYATDLHEAVLRKARDGIFPLDKMKEYTANYLQAGGKHSFSEYYTAAYGNAIFRPTLSKNIVFAQHNLVTDARFNQFHNIWCRNVMIYFSRKLQQRVQKLLCDSLITFGILGLGNQESLKSSLYEKDFEPFAKELPLYRKIR